MPMHKRGSWQIFKSVIFALFVRELKTRFGRWRLGYVWAVLEPLLGIIVLALVVTYLRGREPWFGIPVPVFVGIGFMFYQFFQKLSTATVGAISANMPLFGYRQVKPFDALVTRTLLESLIFIVSTLILMWIGAWFFGYNVIPHDPLRAITVVILVIANGFGLGLIFAVFGALKPEAAKLVPLLNRPLLFLSCVMFPLASVPQHLQVYLLWNPLAHAIEQFRFAMYPFYPTEGTSLLFLLQCAVVFQVFGLVLYTAKRQQLIAS